MRVYRRSVVSCRRWVGERGLIMETITTTTAAILALLLVLPVILLWALWRLSLSPHQNARRMRAAGDSYRAIGAAIGVSHTTARRWCLA